MQFSNLAPCSLRLLSLLQYLIEIKDVQHLFWLLSHLGGFCAIEIIIIITITSNCALE